MRGRSSRRGYRGLDITILASLSLILIVLLVYFFLTFRQERAQEAQQLIKRAQFKEGQTFVLPQSSRENYKGESIAKYKNKLGRITKVTVDTIDWKQSLVYEVEFSHQGKSIRIKEEQVEVAQDLYRLGQEVEIRSSGKRGRISQIDLGQESPYTVTTEKEKVKQLTQDDLALIHKLPFKKENSSQVNNQILQTAIDLSRTYPHLIVDFPKGTYKIGSQTPDTEYILLNSNTEFRGNDTRLVVEGTAYWFALATGPEPHQGVQNFTMTGLDFVANDLTRGDHFMIMANHGENWTISNNSFTMVHKMSSHIFDLGGLQNSVFDNNRFIGYAPELTGARSTEGRTLHNFYSEAIQLDYADQNHVWNGGLLEPIDPNYNVNNPVKQISNNIQITNNQFLAYKDSDGKIIAHSATIGQHSSRVGMVTIINNRFSDLVSKQVSPPDDKFDLFEAVHLESDFEVNVHSNQVN